MNKKEAANILEVSDRIFIVLDDIVWTKEDGDKIPALMIWIEISDKFIPIWCEESKYWDDRIKSYVVDDWSKGWGEAILEDIGVLYQHPYQVVELWRGYAYQH